MIAISCDVDATVADEAIATMISELKEDVAAEIGNPVPYVPYLEYGSSKQAPFGMVRVSLPDAEKVLSAMVASIDFDAAVKSGTLREELVNRVNLAADFVMGLIRDRTPIDTGRARRGWYVKEAE